LYFCLIRYGADAQSYGLATARYKKDSCKDAVRRMVRDVEKRIQQYRGPPDGPLALEEALQVRFINLGVGLGRIHKDITWMNESLERVATIGSTVHVLLIPGGCDVCQRGLG
jgi:hypothetical protein